jgi:glycosyltransferase involved in cell wall biosynthesis
VSDATPAVSVIMPSYNRADVIGRAIGSVLDQSMESFELIVVDDGSTDGTAEAVEAVADPRVTLLRQPRNLGGNAARNRGIEAARAPLIAFLDSDDFYLPDKLAVVVQTFAAHPAIDLLIDSYRKTYSGQRADVDCRNPAIASNDELLEALFTRRIWKATPSISVRRDVALRAGLFAPGLKRRQDFDFILRVAAVGHCASIDNVLWVKTSSDGAISSDLGSFAAAMIDFYRRHPEYYDHPVYRRGFAHDLGRHFVRLARKRRAAMAVRDARQCIRALGPARFAALLFHGIRRFGKRRSRLGRNA